MRSTVRAVAYFGNRNVRQRPHPSSLILLPLSGRRELSGVR